MLDFASLGMKVDTRDVKSAKRDVDGLSGSVKRNATATGSMQKAVSRMEKPLQTMGKVATRAGIALTGAFVGASAAMVKLTRDGLAQVDSIGKVSSKLGIATGELSKLRFAAEQTGVASNTLDMALQRMTRRVSEAGQGTGEAVKALQELGLNAQQLAGQSPDQVFREITDAMEGVEHQSDKVRLAFKLFDSEGASLVNTMALGADGLDSLGRQAEAAGLAVDDKMTAKVEAANDALNTVGKMVQGFSRQLAVQFAPALTLASKELFGAGTAARDMESLATAAFNKVIIAVGFVGDAFRGLDIIFLTLKAGVSTVAATFISALDEILKAAAFVADKVPGVSMDYEGSSFHKFVTQFQEETVQAAQAVQDKLAEELPSDKFRRLADEARDALESIIPAANSVTRSLEEITVTATRVEKDMGQFAGIVADESETATKAIATNTDEMSTTVTRGFERMRDGTGDFFQKMLVDGEASFSDLGDMFKRLIAEMVATAASKQIFSAIQGNGFTMPSGNMQSVLAGGAGFMASNAAFGQTSGLGSGAAGLGAAALGLGPLGIGLAAFAGGGLESLFGGKNNGENAGRAQINLATGQSTIGGVGKTFDEENVSQVQEAAQFAQRVAAAIGGSSAALDITAGRSGLTVGGTSFGQDTQGALDKIFRNVVNNADNLTESLKRLLTGFDGTNEQAMAFADAVIAIDRMSTRNPVEEFRRSLDGPNSLAEAFREQVSLTDTLRTNFDGSAMAAQEYAQALGNTQQMALQLSQALNAVSQQASAQFGATAQGIRESAMGQGELNRARTAEFRELFRSVGSIDSAQELGRVSSRLNELINVRFGSIEDPTQKQAEFFATQAERVNEAIQQRTETLQNQTFQTIEQLNTRTQNMLQQAANTQQQAANTMNSAAQAMMQAASRFGAAQAEVNA